MELVGTIKSKKDINFRNSVVRIQNIISTADLEQNVDVTRFIKYSWGRYDLELYGGRCGYISDSMTCGGVTVFLSGKMISTGCKTVRDSFMQLDYSMYLLSRNGFVSRMRLSPKIQNIVSTADLNTKIDLEALHNEIPRIKYRPHKFPGAILRMRNGTVCLVFSSGRAVITGSKSEKITVLTLNNLKRVIKPFCFD